MPDYGVVMKLQFIACALYLVQKKTTKKKKQQHLFLYNYKTRPLFPLQIFNIMAFHLLNLQIKWQLRLNCLVPWHGDCHHPMSAFLQRVI